jgi:hypothetical protein
MAVRFRAIFTTRDVFTSEKRSWVISLIRSKNTKLDLVMKEALDVVGVGYVAYPDLLGPPPMQNHNTLRDNADAGSILAPNASELWYQSV